MNSWQGESGFSLLQIVQIGSGAQQTPYLMLTVWGPYLRVKRPGGLTDHSPLYNAEVKNGCIYECIPNCQYDWPRKLSFRLKHQKMSLSHLLRKPCYSSSLSVNCIFVICARLSYISFYARGLPLNT